MDFSGITRQYYAQWLGVLPADMDKSALRFVKSAERDRALKGYSQPMHLYAWRSENALIVCYGEASEPSIGALRERLTAESTSEEIAAAMHSVYGAPASIGLKFVFDSLPRSGGSQKMRPEDFPLYHSFFAACNPLAKDISWLREYYDEIVRTGLCFGEMSEGRLVCMNDLPDMPYMAGTVFELGINTLPEFRGRGLASRVCLSAIGEMLARGLCPQWSTAKGNLASERLAYAVGFKKLAEFVTLALPPVNML